MAAPQITPERRSLTQAVLSELARYRGEPIIAHEHPLHKAVVALERICVNRQLASEKHRYALFQPARGVWYRLLWASRPDSPTIVPPATLDPFFCWPRHNPLQNDPPNPGVAVLWGLLLAEALRQEIGDCG